MAGTSVSFTITGGPDLEHRLTMMAARAKTMGVAFRPFGLWFRSQMRLQFDSEGAYLTMPWAARKNPKLVETKILQDTKRMLRSFTEQTEDTIDLTDETHGMWGSRVPYAIYHQRGTTRMVARPILAGNELMSDMLAHLVADYLAGGHL